MKIILLTFLFSIITVLGISQQLDTMVLRGNYWGKNLYVQNPFSSIGVGFCTQNVLVNGKPPPDNNSAFSIELSGISEIGDTVEVLIIHKKDCIPKVLNPEVLLPLSTYEIISINFDSLGVLHWTAKHETGRLRYIIEQFKWNKWISIEEIKEKSQGQNEYTYTTKLTSGKNTLRLKQVDYSLKPHHSQAVEFISSIPKVTLQDTKIANNIVFSDTTFYEMYDRVGNIINKGFAKTVDCRNLKHGVYYISFDSTNGVELKKKR